VGNTTAELLAAYIGHQLLAELKSASGELEHFRIEVDECDGQIAIWEQAL
jgi:hypothetical protein